MTIQRTSYYIDYEITNDSSTQKKFSFPFQIHEKDQVHCYDVTPGGNPDGTDKEVEIPQSQFSVEPMTSTWAEGGYVTLTSTIAVGHILHIQRETALTQDRVFRNQQEVYPPNFELGLDKLTMLVQESGTVEVARDMKKVQSDIAVLQEKDVDLQNQVNTKADISALNAEAATRSSADGVLQGNITAEATARTNGDNALQSQLSGKADQAALNTETGARQTADSNLQTQINNKADLKHASRHASNGGDPITPSSIGAVATNDSRLTDARTPKAHATTHNTGGTDPITPAGIGAVSTTDARLTDARTPKAHASTHRTGGSDPMTPGDIGAATVASVAAKADTAAMNTALAGKADVNHTQAISTINGLQTALDNKADAAATNTALAGKTDKTYVDTALAGKANVNHTQAISTITDLQVELDNKADVDDMNTALAGKADKEYVDTALEGKADAAETAAALDSKVDQADFDSAMAGKADKVHTHTQAQVTGLTDALANKVNYVDLDYYATVQDLNEGLATKAGTATATKTANGLMSSSDKSKLDDIDPDGVGLPGGGEPGDMIVNTGPGAGAWADADYIVSLLPFMTDTQPGVAKVGAGLAMDENGVLRATGGVVDEPDHNNLIGRSDLNQHPIGAITNLENVLNAATAAIATKAAADDLDDHVENASNPHAVTYTQIGAAAKFHEHEMLEVEGLLDALDAKADDTDLNNYATVEALTDGLADKADAAQTETAIAAKADKSYVDTQDAKKADKVHTHAIADVTNLQSSLDGKATQEDIDAAVDGLAETSYVDTQDATKAEKVHTHTIADVTNLQSSLDGKATQEDIDAAVDGLAKQSEVNTALAGKANTEHTQDISTINGLQTALNAKADTTALTTGLAAKADASALTAHTGNVSNPHGVTYTQAGAAALADGFFTATATKSGTNFAITTTQPLSGTMANVRFISPGDFAAGNTITINGTAYTLTDPTMAALKDGAWKSGGGVELLVNVGGQSAFFKVGGGGGGGGGEWNIYTGSNPPFDSTVGVYIPDATTPTVTYIDGVMHIDGEKIVKISNGLSQFFHFLSNKGNVWNCGTNAGGQLGRVQENGDANTVNLGRLTTLTNVKDISCGGSHTIFLTENGEAWGCGANSSSQLGIEWPSGTPGSPNLTKILNDIVYISCGSNHTYYVKKNGDIWNCGLNTNGQLGRARANGSTYSPNLGQLTTISDVKSISCGSGFTCFLKNDGTVWNCGDNTYGQLGRIQANTTATGTPNLAQLTTMTGVSAISCGQGYTTFLKNDGTVWNCGDNTYGQLGRIQKNTTATGTPNLAQLTTMTDVKDIAGGGVHTVFLKNDGTVWNCGGNSSGQLGRVQASGSATTGTPNLAQLTGIGYIISITSGSSDSVFLDANNNVWNCGTNSFGEIGRTGGSGSVNSPNLGQIPEENFDFPLPTSLYPNGALLIETSDRPANTDPLLYDDGEVSCRLPVEAVYQVRYKPTGNVDTELSFRTDTNKGLAVNVLTTPNVTYIDGVMHIDEERVVQIASQCNGNTTHFLTNKGNVYNCGNNESGQLGRAQANGTATGTPNLAQLTTMTGVSAIACGDNYTYFLKNDGTVWNCGYNQSGQLGRVQTNGTATGTPNLAQLTTMTGVSAIACGFGYTTFLKNDGTVWNCGDNYYGQLGRSQTTGTYNSPNLGQLTTMTGVSAIACGYSTYFLKNDGTVWNCGYNQYGQLGRAQANTTATGTPNLAQLTTMTGVSAIACGFGHAYFLKNDGTVWNCGYNQSGQLGRVQSNGSATGTPNLAQLTTMTGVSAISCGQGYTTFLKNDGTVWNCGDNYYGQLGRSQADTTATGTPNLAQLTTMTNVKEVSCGNGHTTFLKNDGTVWNCGYNQSGQLGRVQSNGSATGTPNLAQLPNANFNFPPPISDYMVNNLLIETWLSNDGKAELFTTDTMIARMPVKHVYQVRNNLDVELSFRLPPFQSNTPWGVL